MTDDQAQEVLDAYVKQFDGKLPGQPHHLIAFAKSRKDLPRINYGKAKAVINAAKENKNKPKNGKKPKKNAVKNGKKNNKNSGNNSKEGMNDKKSPKKDNKNANKPKPNAKNKPKSPIPKSKPKPKPKPNAPPLQDNAQMNGNPKAVAPIINNDDQRMRRNSVELHKNNQAAPQIQASLDLVANQKPLPMSPKINPQSATNLEGSDNSASSSDELLYDGNGTTGQGMMLQMQQNAGNNMNALLDDSSSDNDNDNVVPSDDAQSIASSIPAVYSNRADKKNAFVYEKNIDNPLVDINGKNLYHPNTQVNKMMAKMMQEEKLKQIKNPKKQKKIQSLRDWCFDNGLNDIYDKLIKNGYTTCKMLSKCRDDQVEQIAVKLQFTTPQELTFKVAVEELRTQYLENSYQIRHPEEHRSLTDIMSKIKESEQMMTGFYGSMQQMNNEIYAYQMDIEREFNVIMKELNKRKMVLLNDLNKFFTKKKTIIQMKQQTLSNFLTDTKKSKNDVIALLQDNNIDFNAVELRKKKIIELHDDVIMKFMNIKKLQYGLPKANTSFPTTHNMLKEVSRFGVIEENAQNTLGVMPVIIGLENNGKDTKIKIKWELTNDHYGIDPDTVRSIRIEWIEVDELDLMNDIQLAMNAGIGINVPANDPGPGDRKSVWSMPMTDQDDQKQQLQVNPPPMNGVINNNADMNRANSLLMNFAVIQPLHSDVNSKLNKYNPLQKKNLTLDKWMSKQLDFDLYKAINNTHEVNVRKYGKFLVRIKLLGSTDAFTSRYVMSNVQSIKIQRVSINHIKDKFDPRTKHKDLKIGLVNKKTITRAVPGKWRNCFGSVTVNEGVNIWKIGLKKKDTNRKTLSCMIGVINASKAGYMDPNFCEAGGYGFYMSNGCIYHNNINPMKYYNPNKKGHKQIEQNDIISVIVDYYRGTLSFKINKHDCGPAWSNINRNIKYKLAVALRGCDELKLLDDGIRKDKDDEKYAAVHKIIKNKSLINRKLKNKNNKTYKEAVKYQKQLNIDLGISVAHNLSLNNNSSNKNVIKMTANGLAPIDDNTVQGPSNNKPNLKRMISAKSIKLRKKSADIMGKIRRGSAPEQDLNDGINGLKNVNIEKNKMKKKKNKNKKKHVAKKRSLLNFGKKNKNKNNNNNNKKKNNNVNNNQLLIKSIDNNNDDNQYVELSKSEFDISQMVNESQLDIMGYDQINQSLIAEEPDILL